MPRWTQATWERACADDFPAPVAALLRAGHAARIGQREPGNGSPWAVANRWLGAESRELRRAHLTHAYDEQSIRDAADNYSRLCARMHSLPARRDFCAYVGVALPAGRHLTDDGLIARMSDPIWWRRSLRKTWTRSAENALRRIGLIRRGRDPYASTYAVRHRRAQGRRTRSYLESHAVINEDGEQLPLLALAEHSLSNPALRRGEFMLRARGFEDLARDHGHVAIFITLTAPSVYHSQLAKGGENPAYQRAVVRDAQAWLCKQWARVRAKLRRLSIAVYGFRVAEAHHDGTPHWHVLLFVAPVHLDALRRIVADYWLKEYGDEPGAREHRVRFETIDPDKGSACGYLAKYVSKNIDGEGIASEQDYETGDEIAESVERVAAWASVHGIRQFQQIGGACVGLYREARRLREPVADVDLERARAAADAGDWRAFVYAASGDGLHAHRRTSLKLEREPTCENNRYGERRPPRIVGLRYASAVVVTRPHHWHIIEKASAVCSCASLPRCIQRTRSTPNGHPTDGAYGVRFPIFVPSSSLGPVAITERLSFGDPHGWTNPRETSQAGPP